MSGRRIIRAPRGNECSCKAWHQEAARRQKAHGIALVAAGLQILGEQRRGLQRRLLILRRIRIELREMVVPARGQYGARA